MADGGAGARRAAASILHQSRFRNPAVPRPLHGVLAAIGDGLRGAAHAVVHRIDVIGRAIPGGAAVLWVVLAVLLGGVALAVGRAASRRTLSRRAARDATVADALTAAELERRAEAAENAGRFDEALRLRFRSGLTSLADRDVVRSPSSRPSGELSRALSSSDFDALARRFDEVVYGGDRADAGDVADARRRWSELLGAGTRA